MRSPMPAMSHHACSSTLFSLANASTARRNACSSSIARVLKGHRPDHRGTAGRKGEGRRIDRLRREIHETAPRLEGAAQPGRQRAAEVVHPVAVIDPAAAALHAATHLEWVRQPRLAEGNHRRREAGGRLAHAFRGARGENCSIARGLGVGKRGQTTSRTAGAKRERGMTQAGGSDGYAIMDPI